MRKQVLSRQHECDFLRLCYCVDEPAVAGPASGACGPVGCGDGVSLPCPLTRCGVLLTSGSTTSSGQVLPVSSNSPLHPHWYVWTSFGRLHCGLLSHGTDGFQLVSPLHFHARWFCVDARFPCPFIGQPIIIFRWMCLREEPEQSCAHAPEFTSTVILGGWEWIQANASFTSTKI